MTRTWLAILSVSCAFMGWILLALFLLQYGNDWWLSGLITLTVFAWLSALLVVMFQQGRVRGVATGAVIASAAYWLLALGPWFGTNVGPALLTSRGLAQVDVWLHGPPQQTQALAWSYPRNQPIYVSSGSTTAVQTTLVPPTTSLAFVNTMAVPGNGLFPAMGHWLLIWFCAGVGGCAAFLMQLRSQTKPSRAADPIGESPFAPAMQVGAPTTKETLPAPSGDAP